MEEVVVIKTEDSPTGEEDNLGHMSETNKTLLEIPSNNNNCFVAPISVAVKPKTNRHYDSPLMHPHTLNAQNFNNRPQEQQQQQQQQQQGDIPQLHYYNNHSINLNDKNAGRTSMDRANHEYTTVPPGTRCGEIFVTRNARKWTFACTFCNKYTRDIGAFVLHLHKMHPNSTNACDNNDENNLSDDDDHLFHMNESNETLGPSAVNQEQDYVDYSNYLDVNVHTTPDEINFNNSKSAMKYNNSNNVTTDGIKKKRGPGRPPGSTKIKSVPPPINNVNRSQYQKAISQNLLPPMMKKMNCKKRKLAYAEEHEAKRPKPVEAANSNGMVAAPGSTDALELDGSSSLMDYEQDSTYQDENVWPSFSQFDEEPLVDVVPAAHNDDENDHDNEDDNNDDEDDDEDDFDNQLFMPPPSKGAEKSLMVGNSQVDDFSPSVRTVRRQIRGTAFCSICNKTFQYYSLYRNHMTKHSNETPFKCVVCKKGFKSKQAIRYHMHTHEKQKRHKCPLCHAAYYTENQVLTHLLTHENGSIYPCMVCGKILNSDAERDQHLTTHTEERPFRCDYCHKLFRLRHHLSNHLKIHRQYRCDYCKTAFTSDVHQRKPYACATCSNHPYVQRQITNSASSSLSESKDLKPLQILEASMAAQIKNTEIITGDRSTSNDNDNDNGNGSSSSDSSSISSSNNNNSNNNNNNNNYSSSSSSASSNATNSDDEDNDDPLEENVNPQVFGKSKSLNDMSQVWENGEEGEMSSSEKQRLPCTHCQRTYSNVSALNFHIRNKHT